MPIQKRRKLNVYFPARDVELLERLQRRGKLRRQFWEALERGLRRAKARAQNSDQRLS